MYDLRHSFVSPLNHEGVSVVEVARQAGHSPHMALSTYAHVFEELGDERGPGAEEQIRSARREKHVPVSYPGVVPPDELQRESPANGGWAVLGSNQRPPACKGSATCFLLLRFATNRC